MEKLAETAESHELIAHRNNQLRFRLIIAIVAPRIGEIEPGGILARESFTCLLIRRMCLERQWTPGREHLEEEWNRILSPHGLTRIGEDEFIESGIAFVVVHQPGR